MKMINFHKEDMNKFQIKRQENMWEEMNKTVEELKIEIKSVKKI